MKTTLPIITHALLLFFCVLSANAQDVVVGLNVPADRRVSLEQMNYAPWNAILQTFVNDKGEVNYSGLKSNQAAVQSLNEFINSLSYASLTAPASREAHIAFWINAYNSITIRGILDVYPTTSIRNHTSETGGFNIWKNLKTPSRRSANFAGVHRKRLSSQVW